MGFLGFLRPQISCAIAGISVAAINGAAAQTAIKFSLDFKFEGPSAPFLVGIDKGYYLAEGLNVTIDSSAGALEPITRVASGAYDMGFGDINSLIKFRDQNPNVPIKAVFMVYNRPPFSIVTRKSRGVTLPKDLEGKKLGAAAGDGAFAQWKIFVHANGIDASKVAIENVGIPIREPMLAAGQVDAITGFSFSSYVNLKDRGVPIDDVVVLLMADYGVDLYGSAIIVNPKFATAELWLWISYDHKGLKQEAFAHLLRSIRLRLSGYEAAAAAVEAAYAKSGYSAAVQKAAEELTQIARVRSTDSNQIAWLWSASGNTEQALRWFEQAFERRAAVLVWLNVEGEWGPLRGNPRFQALLARMRFPA